MLRSVRDGNLSMFNCKFCHHHCQTIRSHLHHLRNHRHMSKHYFCGYGHCVSSFRSEMALRCHIIRNHQMYVAQTKKSVYRRAAAPLNRQGKYQCPVGFCGEEFLIHKVFLSHLKSHLKSGTPIPCPHSDCVNIFLKWSSLTGHISRKHRIKDEPSLQPDHHLRFVLDPTHAGPSVTEDPGNVCEAFQECTEQPDARINIFSHNDSVVPLAQFYQKLEYKHMVSATVTQIVAEEMKAWCLNMKSHFLTNLSATLESEGISSNTISDIVSSMSVKCSVLESCNSLRTTYMRKKFFQKNFCFVAPLCIPLRNGSFFYYVPIEETIKAAFQNKSWSFSVNVFSSSPNGLLRDFSDGELFKNNRFAQENPIKIVIILYQDGFQLVNPLGPAKNLKHKVIGIYMAFGNLPSEIRFRKESIQLVGLVKQCDFDHQEVYGYIVSDILKLQESGVDLPNIGNVKLQLLFIAGDNLGSHSLGGFVENFSRSLYFCRYCLLHRKSFVKRGGETRRFRRRTPESYKNALSRVKVQPTTGIIKSFQGIKFNSEFNDVKGFHVCSPGLPPCLGHDLMEGIIAYDLKLYIRYFISKGWFVDLDELNELIDSFPYSVEDRKDKPPPIKKLAKERLAGGAWQLWTFLRLFPLIVFGHIGDTNDPVWKCLLLLKDIVEFCVAPEVHVSHLPALQCAIDEYLVTRLELFPSVPLRPKHHYLCHYPELFILFGPLIKVWTLRFESKHTFFNRSWKSSNNSINILQTLAYKHEFLQSWVRSGGGVRCEVETGDRSPFVPSMYCEAVVSALRKSVPSLQLEECDCIEIKGTEYKKGNVIILQNMNMGALLGVGTIHLILIDSTENILFLVRRGTASLVHTYGSFKLNSLTQFDCVRPQDLLSFYPLSPYVRDTLTFISLRHALLTDALE